MTRVSQAVKEKKEAYMGVLNGSVSEDEYRKKKCEAVRVVKESKDRVDEEWTEQLQGAYEENRKLFWKQMRSMRGDRKKGVPCVRSANGELVWDECKVRDRWCEYFECLLAGNAGSTNGETVVEKCGQ